MRLSNKLNFIKLKSFRVLKVLELVMYKLNLPDSIRIIRIWYILVLELVDSEASFMEKVLNINLKSQEKVWEIKKILDIGLIINN